jgi:hypothetical protein
MNHFKCAKYKKKKQVQVLFTDLFVNLLCQHDDIQSLLYLLQNEGFNLSKTILYTNELMYYNLQNNGFLQIDTINHFQPSTSTQQFVFYNCWPKMSIENECLLIINSLTNNHNYIKLVMESNVCVKFFNSPIETSLYIKDFTTFPNQLIINSHDLYSIPNYSIPNILNKINNGMDPTNTIFIFKYNEIDNLFDEFRLFYTTISQLKLYHWSINIEPMQLIHLNLLINYEYNNFEWLNVLNKIYTQELDNYLNLWFDKTLFSLSGSFIKLDKLQQYNSQICFQNNYAPIVSNKCSLHRIDEPLDMLGGFPWNNDSMATLNLQIIRYGPWLFEGGRGKNLMPTNGKS